MKSALLVFFCLLSAPGFAQITDDLLLQYTFNGNANDTSGNDRHATVHGATLAPDRHGTPNSAYYFDGEDDYIEWPNLAELKPQLPVSFAFWIRYDSPLWQHQTVFSTSEEDNRCTGVWFNSTSAEGKFAVNYGDGANFYTGSARRTFVADTVIDTENWYHLAVVVNSETDMRIYVNCDQFGGIYSGTGGPLVYSETPGVLGRHDRNLGLPPDFFKGYIDDFRYWSREISPEEIFGICQFDIPTMPEFAIDQQCVGDDYMLMAVQPDSDEVVDYSYTWTGPENFSASGNLVDISGRAAGTYTLSVVDANGFSFAFPATVSNTICTIPKGISPEGNLDNGAFDLSNLDVENLKIFNRYGVTVYEKDRYENEWHGQDYNGNELPSATYYYQVRLSSGETKTGWVYLQRRH